MTHKFYFLCIFSVAFAISANAQESFDITEDGIQEITQTEAEAYSVSVPIGGHRLLGNGYWDMHEGLNGNLGMGVSVGWGHRNPWRGTSFFTNIAGAYVYPLSENFTLIGGASLIQHIGWGRQSYSGGLFGIANYRFNERMDGSFFISHDFGVRGREAMARLHPYWSNCYTPNTAIGADLGIKVGNHSKVNIGISISREHTNHLFIPQTNANPYGW